MQKRRKRGAFAQEFERLSPARRSDCLGWLRWMQEQVRAGWRGEDIVDALLLHIRKAWFPKDG